LVTGQPQALAYEEIPGFLSAKQLQVHHDKHYVGALKGYHKLATELLEKSFDTTGYSARSRTRTHKANSTVLHELYFSGLAPASQATAFDETLTRKMEKRFGSLDRWWSDFQAAAVSSRGWVTLVYQPLSNKLYNIISDNHGDGVLLAGTPILALDMFEHAYYLDYKNDKTEYIRRFINHINGQNISMRYQQALMAS
jgi:Fe-Mn family superoxide dismutase